MDTPLVSVIISAYNRPVMLLTALRSVQNQSYTNIEILIQDDSTSNECERAIRDINDPRIQYIHNRPSLGTVGNLRAGYRKASGKYFCTLNDDDYYDPTYIATMIIPLETDPRYVLAFCDHWIVGENGEIKSDSTETNTSIFRRNLLEKGSVPDPLVSAILDKSVPGMFALFRRSAIDLEEFPDEVSSGYDYWLDYLAVRHGGSIYYNPQRLTYYRVHSGSQTSSFANPQKALHSHSYTEFMLTRFLADPRLTRIHSKLQGRLAEIRTGMGFNWLRLGERSRAASNLLSSCRTSPKLKPLAGLLLCIAPMAGVRRLLAKS
jgi:glycosyltransferase involved in cell wall biosynthesis